MKTEKKVIDSIAVASLVIALSVTAAHTNVKNTTLEIPLDQSGIAGVAVALREYEKDAAEDFAGAVSVEKQDAPVVAAANTDIYRMPQQAVEQEDKADKPHQQKEEKAPAETKHWENKLMAKVNDFLYVRKSADADAPVVGKMYKGDRALIKKSKGAWTKIESGNVSGYVKTKYCVTGQDAYKYAKKHCETVAEVVSDGLRIRKSPSTDAEVIKAVASGEKLKVDTKAEEKEGWVAVKVDSDTCYVSEEYVSVALATGKAITIEEEQALLEKKAEEAHKAEEARQAEASKNEEDNGQQSTSTSSTQGASLSATADEETLLAALVQCEAGGVGVQGMTAVGAVVVNRVQSASFPNSIRGVIYQSGQFGPASSGRLESRLAGGVSASARQAARAALAGSDPTGGAMYFKMASSGHAGTVIGPIVFY